jgi:hypothetical protein
VLLLEAFVISEFNQSGISFRYPANWSLEADNSSDTEWTVSIQSPATAFILFSLRPDARDPADLADQTLDALKTEYQELDAENRVETIAGQPAIGHDIDFLTVDSAIICRTRCLETSSGPLLIMCQLSEFERVQNDAVLQAIVSSLQVESD